MANFEEFEIVLRDAVGHLYDPFFAPPATLQEVLGTHAHGSAERVQTVIIHAIEALKPEARVPSDAASRRFHELLHHRYVEGLTQNITAERLGISPRHVRGQQWKAVRVLARSLWERYETTVTPESAQALESDGSLVSPSEPEAAPEEWVSQVKQELASLGQDGAEVMADVGATIGAMAEVGGVLAAERGLALDLGAMEPEMTAAIHPSVLRQVLLAAVAHLSQRMSEGTIALSTKRSNGRIVVTVEGDPSDHCSPSDVSFIRELLAAHSGSIDVSASSGRARIELELPAASPSEKTIVLVVDDNPDLVHFYEAYAEGTPYEIVHVCDARRVFQVIEDCSPGIIVLDVMFPDPEVDGWELLVHLHGHPATRWTPIIVCSVIREEQMALTLGATAYLPKPVRCGEFIGALDQAMGRSPTEGLGAVGSTGATG